MSGRWSGQQIVREYPPPLERLTMRAWFRFFTVFVLFTGGTVSQADDFFFHPNDRVMFLGDSVTEQYQYSTDLELDLTTRFPIWNMTFLNAGIGGDTSTDLDCVLNPID